MPAPKKKFSAGGIQVAIWENETKEGKTFTTVSIDRSYKDKDDKWQKTSYFKVSDLPKAIAAMQSAFNYLTIKETETIPA